MYNKCFKCSQCSKQLANIVFGKLNDGFACEACMNELGKTTTITSTVKHGIAIDPYKGISEIRDQNYASKLGKAMESIGGAGAGCPKCSKPVYMNDQVPGPGVVNWHRACLKCTGCKKFLDSMAMLRGTDPFCTSCFKVAKTQAPIALQG